MRLLNRFRSKHSLYGIGIAITLVFSILVLTNSVYLASAPSAPLAQKKQVTLTAILEDQGDPGRWKFLFQPAMQELRARHPGIDIQLNYTTYPYNQTRMHMLAALANHIPIDLITVDQIWLGEFAQKGLLTDLTDHAKSWGREKDWYRANWDGGVYNGKVYAIWAWTDVRGMWYWKDLLNKAGVDPNSLQTWDGYIASAKKLNAVLRPQGIEGVHLVAAGHSPDMSFYPYLWILGGDIIKQKDGHPTKGTYWFPAYNSTEGVRALGFIKEQVSAGIKPQKNHFWGIEFLDRKFAVMLEALQHHINERFPITSPEKRIEFEQKVGFIPMFPVPNPNYQSTTLMGGWELSIPKVSMNKDLAWELLTIMVEPKILAPYLATHSNLPTQIPIGEGPYAASLNETTPYYDKLISMLKIAHSRPSIPEYPQIAEHIHQALDDVYYGLKEPKQALDDAAAKSAKVLGW
jgi:multiple sugar transport system substrate-binding protein